jgi:hypothetical protein
MVHDNGGGVWRGLDACDIREIYLKTISKSVGYVSVVFKEVCNV